MPTPVTRGRLLVVLAALVIATGLLVGPVAGQSDGATGGTIVIEADETVDDVDALAGNVIVRGTVTGDVSAAAGNVEVEDGGEVGGDLEAMAGNVDIAGSVDGSVSAAGGNLVVTETGSVGGTLDAAAGTARLDGTIDGDVRLAAETITLGEGAQLEGDLRYAGTLEGNEEAVAGTIVEESPVDVTPTLQPVASWLFAVYAFVMNLLLGAVLLGLFPRFSRTVADDVATMPIRAGLAGLGVLVGVPILLAAIAITVIGIPITVLGAVAFVFAIWVGVVYGRFAVAAWLLSSADLENPWLALVVGLAGAVVLGQVPIVGDPLNLLIALLGLGALAIGLYRRLRSRHESADERPPSAVE
ncbi:bactofilin family protein [Natrarchaeobaculum sulfurireducens]|uniref:DUF8173 domain-containing protein n=1 Tax=Natrarchaeobaculum sulfurireducens TaxID=2044521 RepID=A0A346PJ21_9EURY|nr:polymer-forming cytoskeletal protein [Natrarchaeobaculum sulfurireducens]AXR79516.1 hypothetical protein AArc1_3211 [Natrarchaeobaculum sulfurireducens]